MTRAQVDNTRPDKAPRAAESTKKIKNKRPQSGDTQVQKTQAEQPQSGDSKVRVKWKSRTHKPSQGNTSNLKSITQYFTPDRKSRTQEEPQDARVKGKGRL